MPITELPFAPYTSLVREFGPRRIALAMFGFPAQLAGTQLSSPPALSYEPIRMLLCNHSAPEALSGTGQGRAVASSLPAADTDGFALRGITAATRRQSLPAASPERCQAAMRDRTYERGVNLMSSCALS